MIGAMTGDIVGSVYEFNKHRNKRFPRFAEDASFTDRSFWWWPRAPMRPP